MQSYGYSAVAQKWTEEGPPHAAARVFADMAPMSTQVRLQPERRNFRLKDSTVVGDGIAVLVDERTG